MDEDSLPDPDSHVGGAVESTRNLDTIFRDATGEGVSPEDFDDYEEAIDYVQKVVSVRPEHPEVRDAVESVAEILESAATIYRSVMEARAFFDHAYSAVRALSGSDLRGNTRVFDHLKYTIVQSDSAAEKLDEALSALGAAEAHLEESRPAFEALGIDPPDSIEIYLPYDYERLEAFQQFIRFYHTQNTGLFAFFDGVFSFDADLATDSRQHFKAAAHLLSAAVEKLEVVREYENATPAHVTLDVIPADSPAALGEIKRDIEFHIANLPLLLNIARQAEVCGTEPVWSQFDDHVEPLLEM